MKKVLGIAVAAMLCVSLVALAGGDKGAGKMGGTISQLDTAQKMLVVKDKDGKEVVVNRLDAIASLGSACIDNEECYLLSKLNRTLGIVYHEHQARV